MQQVCHSVTIIGDGRTVASGRVEALLGESLSRTRVGVGDPARAARDAGGCRLRGLAPGTTCWSRATRTQDEIGRLLAGEQLYVSELSAIRPDLETVFLQLTRDAYNAGSYEKMIAAVAAIGGVGLALDRGFSALHRRFDFQGAAR